MRVARRLEPDRRSPRLARSDRDDRIELWTESVGPPPPVYGERWRTVGGREYRAFEPGRSKLAAGLLRGWTGPIPRAGERWLYLGAATGTTASHVADLLGPEGRLYAVERSPRPFARLLALAERWPNLLPILGDARRPRELAPLVPEVQGLYADIAQPDQVDIVRDNAELFLADGGGSIVMALKTASMGRDRTAPEHLAAAERELATLVALAPSVKLDPFHRGHFLVGGARPGGRRSGGSRRLTIRRPPSRTPARPRS